jgi:hypothetical protein
MITLTIGLLEESVELSCPIMKASFRLLQSHSIIESARRGFVPTLDAELRGC